MSDEFKFPDELNGVDPLSKGEDINVTTDDDTPAVDIVDDTPDQDKRAKPLSREVEDPTDEEIESYSKGVQSRIKELTHARHDERRAKEAALREREEAVRLAQQILEENAKLKQKYAQGETTYVEMLKEKAEAELAAARKQYKEAQESFDADLILEAQEALTDAKMKLAEAKNFRPAPLQKEETPVQIQPSVQDVPRPDDKTLRWQAKNQWFGASGYEEMTAFALGLHQKLVSTGFDPRSDEYFERIDARMKSTFPEVFQDSTDSRRTGEPAKKPATVVASAARTTGAKKTVKLTTSQAALADKLGIPRELYAQEFLKQEARNG